MKFGIAGFVPGHEKRISIAKGIGYDFIESSLCALQNDHSEESIKELAHFIREINMPCVAVNGMFPKNISLLGANADRVKISEYLESAFEKTSHLGYNICVLGSGRSRKVPEDYGTERAVAEFERLLAETIMPIAEKYNKTVVIEPLSYYITNVINTVEQAVQTVKAVGHPQLMALADFFHVSYNKEILSGHEELGKYIGHIHISSFNNKFCFPRPYDGDGYGEFFDFLRRAGYASGNVSVEAADIDFESEIVFKNTLCSSLAYLKGM